VAALREAGAVLVGLTNMPELGLSPVGLNEHHGSARNPWHFDHLCGGSSSGIFVLTTSLVLGDISGAIHRVMWSDELCFCVVCGSRFAFHTDRSSCIEHRACALLVCSQHVYGSRWLYTG
jgi:hypothetical protein